MWAQLLGWLRFDPLKAPLRRGFRGVPIWLSIFTSRSA
ncbi:hypothetical protein ACVIRM_002170 [Rhizobium laguerreae]|jgi:hypothetical protein